MLNWIADVIGKRIKIQSKPKFLSKILEREVNLDIYLPPNYSENSHAYPLVIFNDGQDLQQAKLAKTLRRLYFKNKLRHIIAIGIHAGDRMEEYGTSQTADYKNRGSKGREYSQFILKELLPYIYSNFNVAKAPHAIAGFSLGGLQAFDMVWNNPAVFNNAGVFSGSLWWRSKAFQENDPDADRIIHDMVAADKKRDGLKFWLQTGTHDETDDRNNNGIIDSIDDTLDLIIALKLKGYTDADIEYLEVEKGEHNFKTWSLVLVDFLLWWEGA